MKLKNIDVFRSITPMRYLYERENIPFETAYYINQNATALDSAVDSYRKSKAELDGKYLVFTDDGVPKTSNGKPVVKPGLEENYLKELTELNEAEVELPVVKFDVRSLFGIAIPPKFIDGLSFMFN